ncbi:MAG: putative transcription regulator [Chloroflexi bacterium]|nr:MAG: putative transcription regulator [Chloroflexota bacterium]
MTSNNVTRFLDSKKVKYSAFELPPEKLGAEETALLLNIPVEQIFKTIVIVRQKGKPLLCLIPGNSEVDLKAVAHCIGEKKVSVPTQNEAEKLTGLQAGGISPLALINKGFSVIIDSSASHFEAVHISGGQRGLIIRMRPNDLQILSKAKYASIARKESETDV